ncbi:hypothetical protein [Nonomuraea guangzhouensis]|uniref:Uncharacterized protein n=1 Tax=Nonomuraea guangzhouensis TaxID=1291555 RepID=A0ABW4GNR1_9ACTN|nr:hypothetical protein [Nonomuraea guangzhouensis]
MHPDMHLYTEQHRATELRAEVTRWRLHRDCRRELPPRWAAGVTALGWTLVSAGLRLISLPQRPPVHRSALR